ncbi:MAG: MarR family winged helix-turn-helix transcriptional regulator [Actinomycetota bacterium]
MSSRRLTSEQLQTWRAFLRAHATIATQLETDLRVKHQMPLGYYDVLVHLVEAPKRRLRMTDLADAALISRSGLTRLVDRMVRDGFVTREPNPDDARGVFAVVTDNGYRALKAATPSHLRGVTEYFIDRLTATQLKTFGNLCNRLAEAAPQTS